VHHPAVSLALQGLTNNNHRAAVRDLARSAGYSERRFIDLFKLEVGLKPKIFNRIQRFQRVLAHAHCMTHPDWARIAFDYGYFDQSHLIRDFVAFSGFTPADYVRRLDDLRNKCLQVKFNHLPLTP
jgi:AraC-like DNA-binding protein